MKKSFLQEKVELLDIYHRLRSTTAVSPHFKINEPSIKAIVEKGKEIHKTIAAATSAGMKTLCFLWNTFLISYWKWFEKGKFCIAT